VTTNRPRARSHKGSSPCEFLGPCADRRRPLEEYRSAATMTVDPVFDGDFGRRGLFPARNRMPSVVRTAFVRRAAAGGALSALSSRP
jgi:hypothetical protein